ncbi:VAMP-associated protein [Lipomyces arxii]|uniref:VAMP-associated protein n=1 Tax=Lipomyces arxii TaxID=56418 RepID=UPI0034CF40EF
MEISPDELEFTQPLTQSSTRILRLHNKTSEPMAYKVKTTAPKVYCVKPNASRVNPGEKVDVQIIHQGLEEEPRPNYKCKDKFLIQTTTIEAEQETLSIPDLWKLVEDTAKDKIADCKIRVKYVIDPVTSTPKHTSVVPTDADSFSTPSTDGTTESATETKEVPITTPATVTESAGETEPASPATAAVPQKTKMTGATSIKTAPISPATPMTLSNGVPIPTALFLCLLAFLLGWLFF